MSQRDEPTVADLSERQSALTEGLINAVGNLGRALTMKRINPRRGPERLFHYTSGSGAAAILSGRSFRASRASSLADKLEVKHGISVARRVLSERLNRSSSFYSRKFVTAVLAFLDGSATPPSLKVTIEPFVVCFSPDDRGLLHWLHYGRSGDGYALGFERGGLAVKPFDLLPVMYDAAKQRSVFDDAADQYESVVRTWVSRATTSRETAAVVRTAAHSFSTTIAALAAGMKSPAFAPEHEWRLVSFDIEGQYIDHSFGVPLKTSFATVGNRIVPYRLVEYAEGSLPIRSVVVGSKVDLENARDALGYALRAAGHDPSTVLFDQSAIDLR